MDTDFFDFLVEPMSDSSWSLVKDSLFEISRIESLINRAERLNGQIKSKYSSLSQSFLDAKIQHGKGFLAMQFLRHSRILENLASRIVSKIRGILQEDALSNPNSHVTPNCFNGSNDLSRNPKRLRVSSPLRHPLIHDMIKFDYGNPDFLSTEPKGSSFSLI